MKTRLNLITLALAGFSGAAMANYGLANANVEGVDTSKWECKRCEPVNGYSGSVGIAAGAVDASDNHAANRLGDTDGFAGHVNADVVYRAESGYNAELEANRLGSDNGSARIAVGKAGVANAAFHYATGTHWTADGAVSPFAFQNNLIVNTGEDQTTDLKVKRERYGFDGDFGGDLWTLYGNFQREDKTGARKASVFSGTIANVAAPIDSTTDRWEAGARLGGQTWTAGVAYIASQYNNNLTSMYDFGSHQAALSTAPSNEAYHIVADGQYSFTRTHLAGRFVTGKMTQDDSLVQLGGLNPTVSSFDGEVDTTDASFRVASTVARGLRLTASYDYSDRENNSSVFAGNSVSIDGMSGDVEEYARYDQTRHTAKVGASYRISQGYRVDAGYEYKGVERTDLEREQTDEHGVHARLRISALDNWNFGLKAGYSTRDGSKFEASRATSSEDNALLRRYHLADRDRVETELRVTHTPLASLSIDLTARYANDDYSDTEFGLLEADDYGYDVSVNWGASDKLNLHAFAGQQWIDSEQNNLFASQTSFDQVEDRFVNAGFGAAYKGLFVDALTVGGDYLYADSESNTTVASGGLNGEYGDYFSTSHSVNFYGDYALNEKMGLRLDYRYERYEDSDFANVDNIQNGNVVHLYTLGNLNHNYNAHMVMLSFNYAL
ncbi:MtrB/PioB family decaheme-associated outer membrane protein [Ferrimonas marina]|uniref:Decaheme-associated outer membrane protein, MtrB/PioB family n=1 Tax=Ferrimonas marina TaxID=299255 RepID=A0A1M5YTT1_9GAMM|nr:MtrB/PioB family decaheme-associated outer membrane protein [Ferrimonas marina]SHI15497.1 decaheme-associated outer membrane protein, MtrB/PioB family [Ferrimonas marina]